MRMHKIFYRSAAKWNFDFTELKQNLGKLNLVSLVTGAEPLILAVE